MQVSIDAKVAKLNEILVERKDIDNLFIPPKVLSPTQRELKTTEQVTQDIVQRRVATSQKINAEEKARES